MKELLEVFRKEFIVDVESTAYKDDSQMLKISIYIRKLFSKKLLFSFITSYSHRFGYEKYLSIYGKDYSLEDFKKYSLKLIKINNELKKNNLPVFDDTIMKFLKH